MAAINLDISGNTRQLDRDIQKTVNRVYSINLKTKGDQPLGRITGKVNEFNKSLDASNARVIAFGASAGIIFGIERAFSALVTATIEVQKSLQDINVILNISAQGLQKFGGELFNIARNTGQSFQEVAKAATEFSRQGLGVEETLKRTSEALILSRLSGLDAAKSVETLTAAVNSFASQAVTATEIVNKFATVDAAFAVSSADLADAISRVGSSAAQSGVSLNELIAIVTSAQQTTARGGAVIGNSFKTIFTRLQRGKVVSLLESLGISSTDSSGQVKSTIQLLQDLGKVYDTLGSQQQAYVAEQVGGVFQINILKAALADLGKEYSIYGSALNVAAGATDQAIRRNEELNKTYASQINALQENARQLAAAGGERLLGPSVDRLVGGTNTLLKGFNESDGQGVGEVLGKGILDGIGQFIAGPGLALIGGVLLKLFRDLAKFATGSVQQLLGLNASATQQRDLQQSINSILAKNPQLLELALKGEQGLNTAANSLLASLQKQTVELQKQAAVAAQISKAFMSQAGVRVAGGIPVAPTPKTGRSGKAVGYIPNFSAEVFDAQGFGASKNVRETKNIGTIGGKAFQPNTEEIQIPNMFGSGDTGVIPTYGNGIKEAAKMIARGESGSVLDKSDRNKAKGFIPNFAPANIKAIREGGIFERQLNKYFFGTETDAGNATLDFPPNVLQKVTSDEKKRIGMNPKSFFGDAKRTESRKNQRSLVSKILRTPRFQSTFFNTSPDSTGRIYIPAPGLSMLFLNEGADRGQIASLGINGIDGSKSVGKNTQEIIKSYYQKQGLDPRGEYRVQVPYIADQIRASSLPVLDSGKRITNKTAPTNSLGIPRGFGKKNFASGFIPNFAKASKAETISLGDISANRSYSTKLLSAIIPQPTNALLKFPAQAEYRGNKYSATGLPVSGPNPNVTKKLSQQNIPNLHRNIGKVILDQANVFGQSLGATKFMSSVSELPNLGGVNSAAGVSFEGGVANALGQSIGSKNARVDFSSQSLNTNIRKIFNSAPGSYEAKNRPSTPLINDVFSKFLSRVGPVKPGEVKQVRSGPGYGRFSSLRSRAVKSIQDEGLVLRKGKNSPFEKEVQKRIDKFAAEDSSPGMASGFIPNFADSAILEQIQSKSSFNYKEIKNKPGIEKRINKLYQQYPNLQYLGSGAESHAFKNGNRVLKLPTLDYKTAKQQKAKAKEIGSIDWATATRQLKKAEPNLQLMPIRRVSGSSLVTSQRFAGNTFKDEINDYNVENSLMNLVNSKFERAKASVSEKPNWLRALALDTGSSANFTFMRSLPKEVQIQAREGQIPPESLIKSNKVGLIDPVIYGFMAERLWSEAKAKTRKGFASGFIPNFAAIQAPLQNAINNEIVAGASSNQIRVDKNSKLKTSFNPDGLGVWSKKYEGSLPEGIRMAEKAGINPKTKGMPKAGGYIPNFAIEDPDTQAASLGTAITALVTQLGFLAFSLQGSREQYKQSLAELTETNVAQAKVNSKKIREDISTRRFVGNQVGKRDFSQYTEAGEQAAGRQYKTGKEFGDMRRASRSPLSQERRDAAARELRAARAKQKTAARGTKGQQFAAAGQAGGFALSIGAPILAETAKNLIGQETAGARRTGEAVGAAGQIASFAGAGAMFGPWGAAIGAATGALLTVPGVIEGFLTDFPELEKAANKAAQEVSKFGESSSKLIQASESYADVLSNAQAGPEVLKKAQEALAAALNEVPAQYRDQLAEAAGTGKLPEVSAQIQKELLRKSEVKTGSAQLGKSAGEAKFSALKQNAARAFDFSAVNLINKAINRDLSSNISDQFDPEKELKQKENVDAIQTVVTQSLTGGEYTPEVVKALEKIPLIATSKQLGGTENVKTTGAANEFVTEVKNVDDLRKFLESTGKFDASNIEQFVVQAQQGDKAFEGTVSRINESIATTRNEAISTVDALAKATAKQKEYLENVKKASAAIDAASSSLEKRVAIENLFKSAIENLQENMRGFSQNLKIEQTLTRPREVLGSLIGEDKDPTRRLAAQEGLATIRETQRSSMAGAGIEFKGTLRDILQKPFQENIDKLKENLGQTKEGFKGDSGQIGTQTTDIINKTTAEYQKLNSVMGSVEGYMAQFVSGQISTQQLLEASRSELAGVGIDVSRGSQASDAIEKAVAELEVRSVQEQVKAFQQRAKLASETKQAILQQKIDQALGVFGGFEGFMNRPNEEQNYIEKTKNDFDTARSIRSSADFRYNVPGFADKERDKKAPDLGRAFSGIYRELISQSGGAFRGFIQKEIDSGSQLSGTSGGRVSKTGGFDDIVRGRKVDIDQQLKLAKDQAKIEEDPVLKRTLEGFIKSIESMPGGTEGVAKLQTQKELGVARQSDFQKLFKQYDVAAFEELSKISPELAASLASATALTDDPLLNEASAQTAVQSEILKTIKGLSGQESGMVAPFDIEAYSNEKDPAKRAAMKANYGGVSPVGIGSTASDDVKNQIKAIQDKVLPTTPKPAVAGPQKTIAEIEAETRAKRDQKYLTSPIAPQNRTTGKKFESIEQVDSEMTKALALGAVNPEQKDYYNVLKNFKRNLDPTGGAGGREAMFMYDDMNPQVTQPRINKALQSNQQPAAAVQQSFTQQEATFSNNTSALTTLAGGIENLNSTLANFESNFANLNNVPGTQTAAGAQQAGAQPGIQTTTNAPVTLVVNAESDTDVGMAVEKAILKAIPEIVKRVQAANGKKIPPTVPKKLTTE